MDVLQILLCLCWFASVKAVGELDVLDEVNRLRKLHDAPPLKLSPALNKLASEHAKKMASLHSVVHSYNTAKYSENVCLSLTEPLMCVRLWYNGILKYNYYNPVYTHEAMYFTNMIWYASTEMGVGQALDGFGVFYVVALFNPPARGDYAVYVRPLKPGAVPEVTEEKTTEESSTAKSARIAVSINAMAVSVLLGLFKLSY